MLNKINKEFYKIYNGIYDESIDVMTEENSDIRTVEERKEYLNLVLKIHRKLTKAQRKRHVEQLKKLQAELHDKHIAQMQAYFDRLDDAAEVTDYFFKAIEKVLYGNRRMNSARKINAWLIDKKMRELMKKDGLTEKDSKFLSTPFEQKKPNVKKGETGADSLGGRKGLIQLLIRRMNQVKTGGTFTKEINREHYLAEMIEFMRELDQLGQFIDVSDKSIEYDSPETFDFVETGGQYLSDLTLTYPEELGIEPTTIRKRSHKELKLEKEDHKLDIINMLVDKYKQEPLITVERDIGGVVETVQVTSSGSKSTISIEEMTSSDNWHKNYTIKHVKFAGKPAIYLEKFSEEFNKKSHADNKIVRVQIYYQKDNGAFEWTPPFDMPEQTYTRLYETNGKENIKIVEKYKKTNARNDKEVKTRNKPNSDTLATAWKGDVLKNFRNEGILPDALLAYSLTEDTSLVRPSEIESTHKELKKNGIKLEIEDIKRAYYDSMGDRFVFDVLVNNLIRDKIRKTADAAYKINKEKTIDDVIEYVGQTLSKEEFKKFLKAIASNKKIKFESSFERIRIETMVDMFNTLVAMNKSKMKEARLLEEEAQRHIVNVKQTNKLAVTIEDITSIKPEITDFEKTIRNDNVQILTLRSPLVQKFYQKIAEVFGAELVVVSGNYESKYILHEGKPKIVINVGEATPFSKVFAHEMFHHIVNKITTAEYNSLREAVLSLDIDPRQKNAIESMDKDMQEEVFAEIFAHAVTQKAFYEKLADTFVGRKVARRIVQTVINHIDRINWFAGDKAFYEFEGQIMLDESQLAATHDIIHDMLGSALESRSLNYTEGEKHYHVFGNTVNEVKGYLQNPKKWFKGSWKKLFPKGIKSHRDIMTAMEKMLVGSLEIMNRIKPVGMMSDWLADKEDVRLAHIVSNLAEKAVAKARIKTKPFRKTFINYVKKRQEDLEGEIGRGEWVYYEVKTKNREIDDIDLEIKKVEKKVESVINSMKDRQETGPDAEAAIGAKRAFLQRLADQKRKLLKKKERLEAASIETRFKRVLKPEDRPATAQTVDITATEGKDLQMLHALRDSFSKDNIMEKMHDDIVRGGLVFDKDGKPNKKDIDKALKLGYTQEIIDAYRVYKEISDDLYNRLKEVYPDLEMFESHYGQSLKWYDNDDIALDDSFDAVINSELGSKLVGKDNFTKGKNTKLTTKQLAELHNIHYKTIDPNEMLLDYVRGAERILNLQDMLSQGMATNRVRIFSNDIQAKKYGMHAVNDRATKIFRNLRVVEGYQLVHETTGEAYEKNDLPLMFNTKEEAEAFFRTMPERDRNAYTIEEAFQEGKSEVTHFAVYFKGKVVDYFNTEKEAKDFAEESNENLGDFSKDKFIYKTVTMQAKESEVAKYYFSPDLAKMLNNLLAEDKFRGSRILGISGNTLMNIKNKMTSIEFALSGFHAITITQEMVSSYMGWSHARDKRLGRKLSFKEKLKSIKPGVIWGESRELVTLFEFILANEGQERTAKEVELAQKRLAEILGLDNVDAAAMVDMFFHSGGLTAQDRSLRSNVHKMGEMKYYDKEDTISFNGENVEYDAGKISWQAMKQSIEEVIEDQKAQHPNSPLAQTFNITQFAALEASTNWLMENFIPKVKMATWMREYSYNLEKNKEALAQGKTTEEEIARQTMKFVEDRFGEVNWRNMWMNPTIKTSLQFLFRSFTWFTGSWKALTKAGLDISKLGWFTVKDIGLKDSEKTKYELTEKGVWGINAFLIHMLTVQFINVMAYALAGVTGELPEDDDDDENNSIPLGTKLLFPHIDPSNPTGYGSVPSYVTEGYKIFAHLGFIGGHRELHKLITGRTNSLISNAYDVVTGTDWRGVQVRNPEDNIASQAADSLIHLLWVAPISFSTVYSDWRTHGFRGENLLGLSGVTSAPAVAKRSIAVNLAYQLRREEHHGKSITQEEADLKDDVRRAAYQFAHHNKEPLDRMVAEGYITQKQRLKALSREPTIDGKRNPMYKDELTSAIKNLSIEGTLSVWKKMTKKEKEKTRLRIIKKFHNIRKRKTRSFRAQQKILKQMKELEII